MFRFQNHKREKMIMPSITNYATIPTVSDADRAQRLTDVVFIGEKELPTIFRTLR